MGRPPSDLDDYLEWQQRLENQKASGLNIDDFCLQEGVSKSTFYRWADRLREGIPEMIAGEKVDREMIESGTAAFVPITLKASPVEIELPNGGVVYGCPWESESWSSWKWSVSWARCVPGRRPNHDRLF